MRFHSVDDALLRLIRLSHEMITLADAGDELREDRGCGAVFGKLRDEGYALRGLASRELQAHAVVSHGTTGSPSAAATGGNGRTVLVVDDDPDIQRYLATWFRDAGFETVTAGNGYEAIELATAHQPALISLDMSMPEKSGVSTYRDLKGDPALREIPVIVITAIGRAFGEFLHRRRGVPDPEGFLAKPIDLEQLAKTVQAVLP
jgi:CheY-like chemotaxis protein